MRSTTTGRGPACVRLLLGAGLLVAAGVLVESGVVAAQELHLDPEKVEGPNACGECHESSIAAWKETHHSKTFRDLPSNEDARKIADKLGLKRIKSESQCLSCHFTSAVERGKTRPIAGITCESCHGAGSGYIKVHSDFGGKDVKAEDETPEHKKKRYADSEAGGMLRPRYLYKVAQNCYGCHTVPNEKLVNVGGHTAGSDFELVAWSQGEVRHNVWYSKPNDEASVNRRRMMYIVGQALDGEFALRGVAKATQKAKYAVSMAKRAKAAEVKMAKISAAVDAPEIKQIAALLAKAELRLNNGAQLTRLADEVSKVTQAFAQKYDGSTFSGVDAMLPPADKYQGAVYQP